LGQLYSLPVLWWSIGGVAPCHLQFESYLAKGHLKGEWHETALGFDIDFAACWVLPVSAGGGGA